jgi:GNAT superfamily N-acetyltransferase
MTTATVTFSRMYGFVRARQLEGTYPGDPAIGTWGSTRLRIDRGWGRIPESEWPYITGTGPWPPSEPPGLDAKAKKYRILRYQRITHLEECKLALISHRQPFTASFEITKQWSDAADGVIENPAEGDEIIGSHAISIFAYDDMKRRFKFANSWGENWGNKGYGTLPYEFFDHSLVEAWVADGTGQPPGQPTTGIAEISWAVQDFAERVFHVREYYDAGADERIGWAFAVQGQDYLDVEEFYVRPQFRGRGYGTRLLQSLKDLSIQARLPLYFFVPFADAIPDNLSVVVRLLSKARYYLFRSELRWCPLVARQPIDAATLSLILPSRPGLVLPRFGMTAERLAQPTSGEPVVEQEGLAQPVSESTKLLKPTEGKPLVGNSPTGTKTLPYHYLRALELEGRHPSDAGCWPVTVHRLEIGEGLPKFDTQWAYLTFSEGELFPTTNRPPPQVLWRNFYYRRIRSAAECDRQMLLDPESRPRIAFHLTAAWADPPGGMIPLPSTADQPIPHTHAAKIIERIPARRLFRFQVKWSDWGDRGTGYMPYEYFDRYVFESWAIYGRAEVLRQYKLKKLNNDGQVRWSAHDEEGHHIYAFEVRDARGDERYAWTFVIARDGALEIEELYVRPEFRRLGHGRWLAERVAQLARDRKMPLRLWVGFADCKTETESNYPALVAIAQRLGVQFQACPVSWAAYFGTNERSGEVFPVEPKMIPARPRTPWKELLALVLAMGTNSGNPAVNPPPVRPTVTTAIASAGSRQDFPEIGTEAWRQMNKRRGELIRKKNREGLDPNELAEHEELQQRSQAALERAFPAPMIGEEELERAKAQLVSMPDAK